MTALAGPPGSSFPVVFAQRAVYPRGVMLRGGVLLLFCLAGCLPAPEGDTRADSPAGSLAAAPASALTRTGDAWSDCYRRFQPGGDPAVDLARLADACAVPAGMGPVTPLHEGAQTAADAPERLLFRARRGRCYRAFAVGAPGVEDLDVAVYEPDGHLAAGDVSRDRWPVVPPRGPMCAEHDAVYTIAVAVTRGSGAYVLQIWGTALAPDE